MMPEYGRQLSRCSDRSPGGRSSIRPAGVGMPQSPDSVLSVARSSRLFHGVDVIADLPEQRGQGSLF